MQVAKLGWRKRQAKSSEVNLCRQFGKRCRPKVINSASEVITFFSPLLYSLGVITDFEEGSL